MGITNLNEGEIFFQAREISRRSIQYRVKLGLNFLLQGGEVFTNLSVKENLRMGLRNHGKNLIKQRMEQIFTLFPNLDKLKDRNAGLLSGGERQALAIGMLLMNQPKLLILDEPSSGLSPAYAKETIQKIQNINKQFGITCLIVEQNIDDILKISDVTYIIKSGLVHEQSRTPQEYLEGDKLEKIFLE